MSAPPASGTVLHVSSVDIDDDTLRECAQVTHEPHPPYGIGCVLALRGLCDWGGLPDSAIMRGYHARWTVQPRPGRYITTVRVLSTEPPRTRYAAVDLGYETTLDGALVLTQRQEVLWPIR